MKRKEDKDYNGRKEDEKNNSDGEGKEEKFD